MSKILNHKRIAKNSLMLYLRMFLVTGITLFTSRIVLSELGVIDYGIFNVVGGIVIMFSFVNGAMTQATQRFLSFGLGKENNEKVLKNTFKTSFSIHAIIALIIFVLAETIGLWFLNRVMNIPPENIIAANWVYQFSIITYVISIFQIPFDASVISHEKMQLFAYLGIITVVLKLAMAFMLYIVPLYKLQVYSASILVITIIIFLIYFIYCHSNFAECRVGWYYQKDLFKTMASYAGWSMFGSIAWIAKGQGLNILLNVFFGPAVNAAYGVSNQVNSAVNSFVQNYSSAVNPQIVKSYAAEEYDETNKLIIYGCKLSFFLMLILVFPILMTANSILHIWLKDVPEYAVVFTQLVIVTSLIDSFSFSMATGIQATGKIKIYQIAVGSLLLFNIPISYIFLKNGFNPPIVFMVSLSLATLTIFVRLTLMKKLIAGFSIGRIMKLVILPCGLITSLCGALYYIRIESEWLSSLYFVWVIIFSIIFTIGLIWMIGLNSHEKVKIKQLIIKK